MRSQNVQVKVAAYIKNILVNVLKPNKQARKSKSTTFITLRMRMLNMDRFVWDTERRNGD